MNDKPAVAVDLDGTLTVYPFTVTDVIGPPLDGAAEFMRWLAMRAKVIVHTARLAGDCSALPVIAVWLTEHGIAFDEIWTSPGKPWARAYVDDRAVVCDHANPDMGFAHVAESLTRMGI